MIVVTSGPSAWAGARRKAPLSRTPSALCASSVISASQSAGRKRKRAWRPNSRLDTNVVLIGQQLRHQAQVQGDVLAVLPDPLPVLASPGIVSRDSQAIAGDVEGLSTTPPGVEAVSYTHLRAHET